MSKEQWLKEVGAIIDGVVYRQLASLYRKDGKSIPCKQREEVKDRIRNEILKELREI